MNKCLFLGGIFWVLLIGIMANSFFATLNCADNEFIMMSDGIKTSALPVEDFLKIVKNDAGDEGLKLLKSQKSGISLPAVFKDTLKDSFVVDTVKESFSGSTQAIKSVAKYIVKNIFVGVTLGVVMLIGGTIAWQYVVIPAYCKGPFPTGAKVFGLSRYWYGADGICEDYSKNNDPIDIDHYSELRYALAGGPIQSESDVAAIPSKLLQMAQIASSSGGDLDQISRASGSEIVPYQNPDRVSQIYEIQLPGYCKVQKNGNIWCDKSLCSIHHLIGCPRQ